MYVHVLYSMYCKVCTHTFELYSTVQLPIGSGTSLIYYTRTSTRICIIRTILVYLLICVRVFFNITEIYDRKVVVTWHFVAQSVRLPS